MCANFKPLTRSQAQQLGLPQIPFEYSDEVYPAYKTPLLFKSEHGLEWREVLFGLVPKWAEDSNVSKRTYNARHETIFQKPSFQEAAYKCKFGVIPVTEFYESKYIDNKPQRWGVRRRDDKVFFIAALYEICKINDEVIRSATMLTMDAIDHPMMKEFHEPGDVKRSVVVIPHERLDDWLSLKRPNQMFQFMQGFPVEEFECSYVPKAKIEKITPQLNIFD
ncbi:MULTISPECIES: SOS response-associated peptidase family protein [unclassified Acinetobacter]|uniref:SOS response-associated peptidase n=1 Tax=unclassified Acinetobacter TaxID=196816 RepID=UPI002449D526|nr:MULTISPECIES: SOS response-associated peptidase family protein [unclassified Acinetobacter]MDH0031999.1 SOS response-associated peptidase [Acinetobacter sp. GD04021]MDH0887408.1 SOS response-associated peptidase [Acinetobacter sp. GD03873]MDH1084003.1 SOS response-associated peptidase [Acinetobacter sp. GD03983]MDH2190724.1 SOS response-associated peptidase [Acinetobacter sp. GD03645]MDH2202214.1 SOS response-associated peptidase [Acinetobacter sp. GD03647]